MAKRTTPKKPMLTPEQVMDIEASALTFVETHLSEKFHLLDVAFEQEATHWYLRVYIEGKDARVSLGDCETVSRELDEGLTDAVERIPGVKDLPYSLEVSSPGAFRALSKPREFAFYQGASIRVQGALTSKRPFKPVEGTLESFDSETQTLMVRVGDETEAVKLNADRAVYLNPDLKMPDENAADGEDAGTEIVL